MSASAIAARADATMACSTLSDRRPETSRSILKNCCRPPHDAGLADRRSCRIGHEVRAGYAGLRQNLLQIAGVLVLADRADEPHIASQRHDVDGDIGRAAGHRSIMAVQQHRNRRLGEMRSTLPVT